MTLVAVSYGNSFVVVFCWAWPRSSCCFVALETKRKSGWGICGSSLFVLLWFCVMICHFHRYRPIALCTAFFTTYVVIRTVPQSINGQTRGKKKKNPWWTFCQGQRWEQAQSLHCLELKGQCPKFKSREVKGKEVNALPWTPSGFQQHQCQIRRHGIHVQRSCRSSRVGWTNLHRGYVWYTMGMLQSSEKL